MGDVCLHKTKNEAFPTYYIGSIACRTEGLKAHYSKLVQLENVLLDRKASCFKNRQSAVGASWSDSHTDSHR